MGRYVWPWEMDHDQKIHLPWGLAHNERMAPFSGVGPSTKGLLLFHRKCRSSGQGSRQFPPFLQKPTNERLKGKDMKSFFDSLDGFLRKALILLVAGIVLTTMLQVIARFVLS